ncbi:S-adenosylmethionine:tRNA ribosyltransferase-isomerase [Paenibacillus sp. N1-5-1-14]|uniref:S-adenosylmethionine:tRNA ribosyltransferase-isomerase n=1 Tax=Paenibacillus radicibacter TaxID=2972488 RepID=UPI002158BBBA|nr:S-adenosylmethionine:tRNA ribosyltransferase-isomerase [Paenibacillus radicibacter]MCR8643495.1 S-adenosylmethionine:tRNA ribosyltransferase-isomerase [Paenibacillus radicibacter]
MGAANVSFHLPNELNATAPAERRGLRRDHVRLMVLDRHTGHRMHTKFNDFDQYLQKGDLLVLNSSRTVPAVFQVKRWSPEGQVQEQEQLEVRLARRVNDQVWDALVIDEQTVRLGKQIASDYLSDEHFAHDADAIDTFMKLGVGEKLLFSDELTATIVRAHPSKPLYTLKFNHKGTVLNDYLYRLGQPIRYEYITEPWEMNYYQTVFATAPGSVEMPSAGRAFSWELLFRLQKKGVKLAYIQLHTGLTYLLNDKWSLSPEENYEHYTIPQETVDLIGQTKAEGGRVIAVGTTTVRCLETALNEKLQRATAQSGWTHLHIRSDFPLRVADGLLTGFHEPEASHLDLLSAFIREDWLQDAYYEAVDQRYLWHEFGDMNLIL